MAQSNFEENSEIEELHIEPTDVIKVDAFKKQMKDIIEYRTMEYYRRRYVEN